LETPENKPELMVGMMKLKKIKEIRKN